MANDNKNINELVADDDPTVELEIPVLRQSMLETDASTYDADDVVKADASSGQTVKNLGEELRSRQQTIDHLQFELEKSLAKRRGLESESKAREDQTEQLNEQLTAAQERFSRKEKLIKKRDQKIKLLKSEIRQRDKDQRKLVDRYQELQTTLDGATNPPNDEPSNDEPPEISQQELAASDLKFRLHRSDEYADAMRQQLQDYIESNADAERENDHLSLALETKTRRLLELSDQHAQSVLQIEELKGRLDTIEADHEQEIRTLRFELGSAQNTMLEAEDVKTQLASDLVDAQEVKVNLEKMLGDSEAQSESDLKDLTKENAKLTRRNKEFQQKLAAKNEAITVLIAELSKKTESIEAVHDDEAQASGPVHSNKVNAVEPRNHADHRYSRVLVGNVDDQVLRFPLFKDRITIGRTKENDIQLVAAYVSRRHAVVQTDDEATRIIDWGSKNGIHVNSKRISEHFLKHGDIVTIGKALFRYEEHKKRDA